VKRRIELLLLITELNVGGAERIVEQLATHLPGDRYEVKVACLYDPHAVGANIEAAGIPLIDFNMRGKGDVWAAHRLLRFLQENDIQILHAHLFHANLLAATVGRMAGTPVVIATRHSVEIGGGHRERLNRLLRPLCDAVVTVSRQVYEVEIKRSGANPAKIVEIPSGVAVDTYVQVDRARVEQLSQTWHLLPRANLVGTVGRFEQPKGHIHLLEAMMRVHRQHPGTRALLVGDGPLRPPMEAKARELSLSETVTFTGIRRDVAEILALLDIFVLPSLWEGLPVAVLEAMAAGLPVVATRVGGVPEVVIDGVTGLLVPPRNPDALSEAILRLLQDPDLRHRMGQAGRERVRERFSLEQMIRKTEALYERLLAEKELL
jgi:glycosyltransferase involved in cell wall biosynthesis